MSRQNAVEKGPQRDVNGIGMFRQSHMAQAFEDMGFSAFDLSRDGLCHFRSVAVVFIAGQHEGRAGDGGVGGGDLVYSVGQNAISSSTAPTTE